MRARNRLRAAGMVAFLSAVVPRVTRAQSTVIITSVRDSTGAPVLPSRIDVKGMTLFALGDSLGRVVLPGVPLGHQTLRVRGVGFWERRVAVEARGDTLRMPPLVLHRNPLLDSLYIVIY